MIRVVCPRCGRSFKLRDELAGKKATCPCGTDLAIPPAPAVAASAWEDEIRSAFGETRPRPTDDRKPPEIASAPPPDDDEDWALIALREDPAPRPSPKAAPGAPPPLPPLRAEPRRALPATRREYSAGASVVAPAARKPAGADPWPRLAAVASAVYGAVVMLMGFLSLSRGFYVAGILLMLGAGMIYGAVATFRGDPNGPTWMGLAALGVCAGAAWGLIAATIGFLGGGSALYFLQTLAVSAIVYCVPAAVAFWALRREAARRTDEQEEV